MPQRSPLHTLTRLVPGVREVSDQIEPYAEAWATETADALAGTGRLIGVLGDSTAQGIGASSHRHGWVGQVHGWLEGATGDRWDVANWSRTGARVAEALDDQLPRLLAAPRRPDLVLVAVGSNDVFWGLRTGPARRAMTALVAALPTPAVVATVPAQGLAVRAHLLNRHIRAQAAEAGVEVAEVARAITGGRDRLAADRFHPNELGYAEWATGFRPAVAGALGLRG
jgi:lysophospholipase L1-like esterase